MENVSKANTHKNMEKFRNKESIPYLDFFKKGMLRILTHETAEITAVVSWPKASGCCLKIRMTRNSAGNFSGT